MFICVIQAYYSEGNLRITKTNERSRFRLLVNIITTSPISMKFSIWMVMALWIMRKGTGYFLPWWTTYTRAGPRVYAFLWNGANELTYRLMASDYRRGVTTVFPAFAGWGGDGWKGWSMGFRYPLSLGWIERKRCFIPVIYEAVVDPTHSNRNVDLPWSKASTVLYKNYTKI